MGPVAITLTTDISEVAVALSATTFEGGPKAPIGQCVAIPPNSSDITLAYVRPVGHASAGDRVYSGAVARSTVAAELAAAVPTLERVYLPANSGGQIWMYIRASGSILRGNTVSVDVLDFPTLGVTMKVTPAAVGASNVVKGVAQWNIDDDEFGWVLVTGVGKLKSTDNSWTVGDRLAVDTGGNAGEVDLVADLSDPTFAVALEDTAAAQSLFWADIGCIA